MRSDGFLINGLTIMRHAAAIARTQKIEGFFGEGGRRRRR